MGNTHNPDHYKVGGSRIEERGIASRDRRRLGIETARLQRKASINAQARSKPTPTRIQPAARDPSDTQRSETTPPPQPTRIRIERPDAEVKDSRFPNAPPPNAREHDQRPNILRRAEDLAHGAHVMARRVWTTGTQIVSLPFTLAKVIRKMREEQT